jgi:hypothetical protein
MNRGVTAISFDLTKSHKKERGGGLWNVLHWFTYAVWLAVPSFVTAWSLRQLTLQKIFRLLSASKLLHLALAIYELVLVIVVQCSRTAITSKAMNCCIVKTVHYPITITILQSNSKQISNRYTHRVVLFHSLCSAAVVIYVYRE